MKYRIFRLLFSGKIHLGTGMLESAADAFYADTLFSALCCETVKSGSSQDLDTLVELCRSHRLMISDAMPFSEDTLFLPKPFLSIHSDNDGDSRLKKLFKKLRYIPSEELGAFAAGTMNPEAAVEKLSHIGTSDIRTLAHIYGEDETMPYQVGEYRFREGCGLYFIAAGENEEALDFLTQIVASLGYSGIGGKRTAGLGRFTFCVSEADRSLTEALERGNCVEQKMTISVSLPANDELKTAVDGASYSLIKRSGFVFSYSYADTFRKKNDLYVFQAGSCFRNGFRGDIYDVSDGGAHPVYRYAIPMFIAVR